MVQIRNPHCMLTFHYYIVRDREASRVGRNQERRQQRKQKVERGRRFVPGNVRVTDEYGKMTRIVIPMTTTLSTVNIALVLRLLTMNNVIIISATSQPAGAEHRSSVRSR